MALGLRSEAGGFAALPAPGSKLRSRRCGTLFHIQVRAIGGPLQPLSQLDQLSSQPAHFGTLAAKKALQQAEQAATQAKFGQQGSLPQQLSSALSSAQQALSDAAHAAQDALSGASPLQVKDQLIQLASAAQSFQHDSAPRELQKSLAATTSQASAALSSLSQKAQQAGSSLHLPKVDMPSFSDQGRSFAPSADLDGLVRQARDAASRLVPDIPGPGPGSLFGRSNLPPHFGTQAAEQAVQKAGAWAWQQLHSLQSSSPQARLYLQALSSQARAAQDFVQHNVLCPVEAIPHLINDAVSPGVRLLRGTSSSVLSNIGAGYSPVLIAALLLMVTALVLYTAPSTDEQAAGGKPVPEDELATEYDAGFVAAYWARRPGAVGARSLRVGMTAARVGAGILVDRLLNREEANAPLRARQLRMELERLGPAYVKVAQAVSTRVDILSPAYLLEIELLQDRVPPFPSSEAVKCIEAAVGQPVRRAFTRISSEPVASASLGQVYRGTLNKDLGGAEVAVKVQRPHVLAGVALDLFLMRWVAIASQRLPQVTTDWVGLIDEWALRFFHELDYMREAQNSQIFSQQMASLEGISVSQVFPGLSNRNVLTTAWVQGEKLSESTAGDVRALCNTLLNCYLIQLLETGFLHADPHPGNLLRTPDGRICILDFGMMTNISPDRSIALVEYISHLSVADWTGVARDLTKLGFTEPGGPDLVEAGVVAPLGRILEQLSRGGGAKGVNIDQVIVEVEDLAKRYPFQIPSYFALILRCFSVIEGIALRVDPSYSIVQECFPYLARRLLTDDHPRTRAALRQLLYGGKARLDVHRLQRLTSGFASFTVSGLTTTSPDMGLQLNGTAREALKVVFSSRGNYVQEVVVEEAVAAADAWGREALSELCARVLGAPATVAALAGLRAMGPLRPLLLPLPTPLELLTRLQPAVEVTQEDEEALDVARTLLQAFSSSQRPALDLNNVRQLFSELAPLLPELLPGFAYTSELFARALLRRIALRVADEARPRPQTGRGGASALAMHRTNTHADVPVLAVQGHGTSAPDAALRMLFGTFLPQKNSGQQRSASWHVSQRNFRPSSPESNSVKKVG